MNFTEQLKNKNSTDYKSASANAKLMASTMHLYFYVTCGLGFDLLFYKTSSIAYKYVLIF